jgi:hypothetical protein
MRIGVTARASALGRDHGERASAKGYAVSDETEFAIGAAVSCEDGECGDLRRLIVDSSAEAITHLVVEPKHQKNAGRLVPIDLVENTTEDEVRLRCTLAQFDALDAAEEIEGQPGLKLDPELQRAELRGYGRGPGGVGPITLATSGLGPGEEEMGPGMLPDRRAVTEDNIPDGEGEVSPGQPVHASDGPIGRVHALVTDPSDHHVTHVLLGEGHLWGKKEVAIPISAVRFVVDDGVYLNVTKEEVGNLPPLDPGHTEAAPHG